MFGENIARKHEIDDMHAPIRMELRHPKRLLTNPEIGEINSGRDK